MDVHRIEVLKHIVSHKYKHRASFSKEPLFSLYETAYKSSISQVTQVLIEYNQ